VQAQPLEQPQADQGSDLRDDDSGPPPRLDLVEVVEAAEDLDDRRSEPVEDRGGQREGEEAALQMRTGGSTSST
jgi:hypothetical protein